MDLEHQRQKARHRDQGGQHDRAESLGRRTHGGLIGLKPLPPQLIESIDQHDVVANDNPGQGNHASSQHDHRHIIEGVHEVNLHPQQHADRRQDHGRERHEDPVETVELPQQDNHHHEQRRRDRGDEEHGGLASLFVGTGEFPAHGGVDIGLFEPGFELCDLLIGGNALQGIGLNTDQPLTVAALDGGDLLRRHTLNEVAGRDRSIRRGDL